MDHVSHDGRLGRRQAADILRDAPQLGFGKEFLLEQIAERRHRRAVEPGAQAVVDVLDGPAAVEAPVLVQVGCEHRVTGVILERWRRGTVAAALVAVAFAAADGVVELPSHLQRLSTAATAGSLAERNRLRMLSCIGKVGTECLDVCQYIAALMIGQPTLPCRHRGARQSFIDRAQQIRVYGKLTAGCRTNLIKSVAREIARRGNHAFGGLPVARAVVAVTAGAPFHVDLFPRRRVLGE